MNFSDLQFMIENKADLNTKNGSGETPFDISKNDGNLFEIINKFNKN